MDATPFFLDLTSTETQTLLTTWAWVWETSLPHMVQGHSSSPALPDHTARRLLQKAIRQSPLRFAGDSFHAWTRTLEIAGIPQAVQRRSVSLLGLAATALLEEIEAFTINLAAVDGEMLGISATSDWRSTVQEWFGPRAAAQTLFGTPPTGCPSPLAFFLRLHERHLGMQGPGFGPYVNPWESLKNVDAHHGRLLGWLRGEHLPASGWLEVSLTAPPTAVLPLPGTVPIAEARYPWAAYTTHGIAWSYRLARVTTAILRDLHSSQAGITSIDLLKGLLGAIDVSSLLRDDRAITDLLDFGED